MSQNNSTIIAWFKLARIANWPSAASNIFASYLVANGDWSSGWRLAALIATSLCLFAAGMILNDWHDFEEDRLIRRDRPLPSGEVSKKSALAGVFVLFSVALSLALLLDCFANQTTVFAFRFRATCIVAATILFIWLYDVAFKAFAFAPILMGCCRGCNFLLGSSTGPIGEGSYFGLNSDAWVLSLLITIYVSGVTLMARRENSDQSLRSFSVGSTILMASLAGYCISLTWLPFGNAHHWSSAKSTFCLLLCVVGVTVLIRVMQAIGQRTLSAKSTAIVLALQSMILIDAAIALLFSEGQLIYGCLIILLMPLSYLLSRLHRLT